MKLKKLSLLAGAIAVAFSITPLAVNAQAKPNAPQGASQVRPPSPEDLELTEKQKTQIGQILAQRSTQMQAVLTPQQSERIKKDLQAGKKPQQVLQEIKFSEEQKVQLGNIMKRSDEQIFALLTPEQKKKVNQWRAKQQQQRQQR
ncbi:MAG: Spy/CpxP family protein refolding chaperone [Rivularia sp. (in: cyanobacteria)]